LISRQKENNIHIKYFFKTMLRMVAGPLAQPPPANTTMSSSPLSIAESARAPAQPATTPPGWTLLRLGFRPLYLGAALFALLSVPLWVALFL
jgi:hypothetical protein